jgi:transposase, IS30 family
MAVRFSKQMIHNLIQPFWAALQGGEFLTDAAALAGTRRHRGLAWELDQGEPE